MADVTLTFRIDVALKNAFAAMAEEQDLSAAQLLRRMMRTAVEEHQETASHERWQRREIEDAMHEADATQGLALPNDAVEQEWRQRKDEIARDGT